MPASFKGGSEGCDERVHPRVGSGRVEQVEVGVGATLSGDLKTLQMDPHSFSLSPSVCFIISHVLFILPVNERLPFIFTSFPFPLCFLGLVPPDAPSAL